MSNPKTNQKLALRTLAGVLVLGGLFLGYQKFASLKGDFDRTPAKTVGWVIAVRQERDGSRVVGIDPDGRVVENPGWKPGVIDRDPAWSPDGNRAFFVSDRESQVKNLKGKFTNIFRWNPTEATAEPLQRTTGTAGRSLPSFSDEKIAAKPALITSRGFVMDFDQTTGATRQILPPLGREVAQSTDEEGTTGSSSQFTGPYAALGTSFRSARWCGGGRYVVALMQRDEGEVLVVQDLEPVVGKGPDGREREVVPAPRPLAAGERIEFSVSRKDGSVAFAVRAFDFNTDRERIAAARAGQKLPFRHLVGFYNPKTAEGGIVQASQDDGVAFASPVVSPDGASLLLTAGPFVEGELDPKLLVSVPFRENGGGAAARLLEGAIYEPSFSPDGSKIVLIRREGGRRTIVVVNADGSAPTVLTKEGSFSVPKFSPQR